ncbi:uncharacterized protein LOC134260741 isoform X2 [Saccostrea cucullata]|uniref:uncharacterized protein LOC134260741 isoform X2 n=1 Tax=Saccostrea cuccullata TaxID=36930 RepID=UPI002ED5D373
MPVCVGEINDQSVQVLRDTGCNGVILRRSLVHDDQLTGDHQVCVLADGYKIETPIAKVNVDTPYFVGEVNAWCLKAPLYPLIIGNIPHARDPHDPNKDWKPSVVNAVVTRQQKRMEGHLATSRTIDKVLAEFYWPGVQADARRFCRSCDICQRTTPKGRTTKVPMSVMPIIDEPFRRVAVDLVGPIQPMTDNESEFRKRC